MDNNPRYHITDIDVTGVIFSTNSLRQYGDGNGVLREIVIKTEGVRDIAYVPLVVFGDDAKTIDADKTGYLLTCKARLNSRQWQDKNGNPRWALSLTGYGVQIKQAPVEMRKAEYTNINDDTGIADDIPF